MASQGVLIFMHVGRAIHIKHSLSMVFFQTRGSIPNSPYGFLFSGGLDFLCSCKGYQVTMEVTIEVTTATATTGPLRSSLAAYKATGAGDLEDHPGHRRRPHFVTGMVAT